jgi:type IV fimbrial biogenesis protein FimT
MPSLRRTGFNGLTLLEVLVVLALLGILMALAAPGVSELRQKHQMQSQGERLLGSLLLARTEAVRRQQRVTLCVRGVADRCISDGSWGQGWVVFVDANDNAVRDPQEVVLQLQEGVPAFLKLEGNATVNRYVSFGVEGRSQTTSGAFQAGTLTLCRPGHAGIWRVVINAVGKPRLEAAVLPINTDC